MPRDESGLGIHFVFGIVQVQTRSLQWYSRMVAVLRVRIIIYNFSWSMNIVPPNTDRRAHLHTYNKHTYIIHISMLHTYIHTYVCTYVRMYACTYVRTYASADVPSFVHSFMHAWMHHAFMHSCIRAFMHSCIHSFSHSFFHSFIHSFIHAFMRSCIHAFMHKRKLRGSVQSSVFGFRCCYRVYEQIGLGMYVHLIGQFHAKSIVAGSTQGRHWKDDEIQQTRAAQTRLFFGIDGHVFLSAKLLFMMFHVDSCWNAYMIYYDIANIAYNLIISLIWFGTNTF